MNDVGWSRNRTRRVVLWAAVALAAVLAAYGNSFENGFHFDDFHTVTDNPAVRSLRNVPRFFTDAKTFSVLPANRTYRPVVSLSLALDYALGHGYNVFWFHLSTFVWFVGLLALLFLLYEQVLERTLGSPGNVWLALIGAAWFGLHPAMAETVNYVIQRGDVYCTVGCVGALVVWTRWPQRRRWGLYLLPLVFALLSKPPAAVFPVLLFFCVFFFEAEGKIGRWRRSLVAALPSVGMVAVLMALQSAMTPKSFMPSILSPWDYRLVQPFVWLRYFGELFLPIHLNVDTDLTPFRGWNLHALVGLLFLAALCAAIGYTARRRMLYPIAYGLIWFVVTQLPTSLYPLSEAENDHRMFFSFPGLILAVVWAARLGLHRLLDETQRRRVRPVLVGCVLLGLSGYAWGVHVRNRVWHTEGSLWLDDVAKSPRNGRGLMNYGLILMGNGAYPQALDYFEHALQYTPNYSTLEINLGVVNGAMKHDAEAQRHFLRAIALAPNDDQAHAFYGRWLAQTGRMREAITELKTAITLNPARPFGHEQLLAVYAQIGDAAALRATAVATLQAVPGDPVAKWMLEHPPATEAHGSVAETINRSLELNHAGKYEESIAVAQAALRADPDSAEAWNNIAAADEALHRWDAAILAAQKAIALKPDFQLAKNNLAWSRQHKQRAGTQ
jgi:Flp pilus assembly protein TadD